MKNTTTILTPPPNPSTGLCLGPSPSRGLKIVENSFHPNVCPAGPPPAPPPDPLSAGPHPATTPLGGRPHYSDPTNYRVSHFPLCCFHSCGVDPSCPDGCTTRTMSRAPLARIPCLAGLFSPWKLDHTTNMNQCMRGWGLQPRWGLAVQQKDPVMRPFLGQSPKGARGASTPTEYGRQRWCCLAWV